MRLPFLSLWFTLSLSTLYFFGNLSTTISLPKLPIFIPPNQWRDNDYCHSQCNQSSNIISCKWMVRWEWNVVKVASKLAAAEHAKDGVFERYPLFIAQEWFTKQRPGDKTQACSLCGSKLGFWAGEIGVMGHAAGSEFNAQMDLGTLVQYSYTSHPNVKFAVNLDENSKFGAKCNQDLEV